LQVIKGYRVAAVADPVYFALIWFPDLDPGLDLPVEFDLIHDPKTKSILVYC